MLSATADHPGVNYAAVVNDPAAAEAWVMSLPEVVRARFQARLAAIYRGLPPVLQLEVQRSVIAKGEKPVLSPVMDGLGQWGATLVSLANVGASLFNAYKAGDLQKDIAEGAQATSAQIAAAQAQANKEAQLAMIEAQSEAVKLKAINSAQMQSAFVSYLPAILGGVGVLALAFVVIKARSKRSP